MIYDFHTYTSRKNISEEFTNTFKYLVSSLYIHYRVQVFQHFQIIANVLNILQMKLCN